LGASFARAGRVKLQASATIVDFISI